MNTSASSTSTFCLSLCIPVVPCQAQARRGWSVGVGVFLGGEEGSLKASEALVAFVGAKLKCCNAVAATVEAAGACHSCLAY